MKVAFMTKQVFDCNQLSKIGKNGYPSLLSSFCRWRLGNQMSSLATGYALWDLFKIRNFIVGDQYETLKSVFDLPVPKSNYVYDWPYHVWNESMKNLYSLLYILQYDIDDGEIFILTFVSFYFRMLSKKQEVREQCCLDRVCFDLQLIYFVLELSITINNIGIYLHSFL